MKWTPAAIEINPATAVKLQRAVMRALRIREKLFGNEFREGLDEEFHLERSVELRQSLMKTRAEISYLLGGVDAPDNDDDWKALLVAVAGKEGGNG